MLAVFTLQTLMSSETTLARLEDATYLTDGFDLSQKWVEYKNGTHLADCYTKILTLLVMSSLFFE